MSEDDRIHDSMEFIEARQQEVNRFIEAVHRFLCAGTPGELGQATHDVKASIADAAMAREYLMSPPVKRYFEAKAAQAKVAFRMMSDGTLEKVKL